MMSRQPLAAIFVVLATLAGRASAEPWEAVHLELRQVLAELAEEHFSTLPRKSQPEPQVASLLQREGSPAVVAVGFTGGREKEDSKVSGVVRLHRYLEDQFCGRGDVITLVYDNSNWQQAAERVLEIVDRYREASLSNVRQPLILVYGHSLGTGAMIRLARELQTSESEISLAVFLDSFGLRNPRLPENIRFAVNFYQRAGFFSGWPIRGKRKLIPENPAKTEILGSYRVVPDTDRFGWSWNLLQPLFFRQHHRLAHDVRLRGYLDDVIKFSIQLHDLGYSGTYLNRDLGTELPTGF
ncbi:MAG: hypothetical protein HYX74_09765 [Acidobacteria bacterium]|nr:hypothetical protein [Acidobacteriota bacterium]